MQRTHITLLGGLALSLVAAGAAMLFVASSYGAYRTNSYLAGASNESQLQQDDQLAREQLLQVTKSASYHVRLPAILPTGYLYNRVTMDGGPRGGFGAWMRTTTELGRGPHFVEGPYDPSAPKNSLDLPGLSPVVLANGTWMAVQKADMPYQGYWIYVITFSDVEVEVDGPDRAIVEAIASAF